MLLDVLLLGKRHPAKTHNPGARGTHDLPSAPKLPLIALLHSDLKTLRSNVACGYLCPPPHHAKHKSSRPRPPLTLSSNLTSPPCQQQSLPVPLALQLSPPGPHLERGVCTGETNLSGPRSAGKGTRENR